MALQAEAPLSSFGMSQGIRRVADDGSRCRASETLGDKPGGERMHREVSPIQMWARLAKSAPAIFPLSDPEAGILAQAICETRFFRKRP